MSLLGPSLDDPLARTKEATAISFIDAILEKLTLAECIELCHKKTSELPESRETSMVKTKLDEAEMWLRSATRRRPIR